MMKKKILLALLFIPTLAGAAQKEITVVPDNPVLPSIGSLKDAVNLRLADIDENFDEIYPILTAGPVYVNTTAPADTKVVWIDTDQDNAIKVNISGTWTVVGTAGEAYTLPTASADTLGGIKVGSRLTITDGVLSADVQTGDGDDLGSADYIDVVALWTTCTGYLKSDGTCDTPSGSATYPSAAGVANWTGSAWGTSYTVGTEANNLVKLNDSAQLPAVSAALLTNFPTLNQNTTGTAGGLSGSPNITVGTISAGAGGMTVDADGDAVFKSVTVTRTTSPTAIDLYEGTGGGDNKLTLTLSGNLAADATVSADQILVDGDIGSTVQAYDADLTSAAGAGAAGASKYFGTNSSSVVGFYDLPSGGGTPTTITVADTTDTTAYVALFDSATGDLGPKTDTGITYNAGTGMLTATGFTGPLTGTASGNLVSGGAAGTPSSITLTNGTGLPISGLTNSTSAALGLGSVELGHASDTTIARSGAGVVTVEGVTVTRTIASGTAALGTAAISSGACATAVSATATGTATTDTIGWGFSGDPTSTTGYQASANGMLTIIAYPTSGNVNFKVCNNTAASVTPGAVTLNWKVFR